MDKKYESFTQNKAICGEYFNATSWSMHIAERKSIELVIKHQKDCLKCQRIVKLNKLNNVNS